MAKDAVLLPDMQHNRASMVFPLVLAYGNVVLYTFLVVAIIVDVAGHRDILQIMVVNPFFFFIPIDFINRRCVGLFKCNDLAERSVTVG